MANVLVVYATDYGNTKRVAEVVADGASSVLGTKVELRTADDATADDLGWAQGIAVGSPVHMGSPDWRVKRFIDRICSGMWMRDMLVGKVGGVFATGSGFGSAGGGGELTLLSLMANFAELGCVLVPLPKCTPGYVAAGLHWGPWARSAGEQMEQLGVSADRLEVVRHHGANIARLAAVLHGKTIFAKG